MVTLDDVMQKQAESLLAQARFRQEIEGDRKLYIKNHEFDLLLRLGADAFTKNIEQTGCYLQQAKYKGQIFVTTTKDKMNY